MAAGTDHIDGNVDSAVTNLQEAYIVAQLTAAAVQVMYMLLHVWVQPLEVLVTSQQLQYRPLAGSLFK